MIYLNCTVNNHVTWLAKLRCIYIDVKLVTLLLTLTCNKEPQIHLVGIDCALISVRE